MDDSLDFWDRYTSGQPRFVCDVIVQSIVPTMLNHTSPSGVEQNHEHLYHATRSLNHFSKPRQFLHTNTEIYGLDYRASSLEYMVDAEERKVYLARKTWHLRITYVAKSGQIRVQHTWLDLRKFREVQGVSECFFTKMHWWWWSRKKDADLSAVHIETRWLISRCWTRLVTI